VPSYFDVRNAELEEITQPNIFDSKKSGGIIRLGNILFVKDSNFIL